MTVKTDVYIDGILLPRCSEDGIKITPNKLYASNSGRSETTGDFIGDIVAIKYDITLNWDFLRETQFNAIDALVTNTTVEHTVKMMFDGITYTEKQCYLADMSRTVKHQRSDGVIIYGGISLHIVQI